MRIHISDQRAVAILLAVCALLSFGSLAGLAYGESSTYSALASLPPHVTDAEEPPPIRERRLRGIAAAIDGAARDRTERAALIVLAYQETRLARYVQEDRCSDGPRGDRECDSGLAHGLWQIHDAPRFKVPESLDDQAKLARKLWSGGRNMCRRMGVRDELAGAYVAYGTGGKCSLTKWAEKRAAHLRAVRRRL